MTAAPALLALVTDAFGGHGGIAQYNRDLLRAITATDRLSSVTVFPRIASRQVTAPAGIRQMSPHLWRSIYVIAAICRTIVRPVDIVFCGHLYMAPLARFLARLKNARLIMQMHGVEAWPHPTPLQRSAVEAADLVLCVSRYTRVAVLNWADIAPERVVVVANTVGDTFSPEDATALRAGLGLDGKRVLLTVARMDGGQRYKGHDRVIGAIPDIVSRGHDAIYLVAGEGDDRARLEQCARDAGIAERVRFLGPLPPEAVVDYYRMADLYVMPSIGEGFGIAFIEAMASGTPALGLAVAGASDALCDGELGTAVKPEEDLAAAISSLLSAPRPAPLTLSNRTRARFGRDVFRERVRLVFDRLLTPA